MHKTIKQSSAKWTDAWIWSPPSLSGFNIIIINELSKWTEYLISKGNIYQLVDQLSKLIIYQLVGQLSKQIILQLVGQLSEQII